MIKTLKIFQHISGFIIMGLILCQSAHAQKKELKSWGVLQYPDVTIQVPARCEIKLEKYKRDGSITQAHELDIYYAMLFLHTYAHSMSKAKHEELLSGIQTILHSIPESDPCFSTYMSYYALLSFAGYDPHRAGIVFEDSRSSDDFNQSFELLKQLFEQQRLIPLTKDLKKYWGGIWEKNPHKIMGAYECQEDVIYFDPYQPPYNLAAVLSHELEHLVRDKTYYWDHAHLFTPEIATTLLLDEAVATLRAGFFQLSFFRDNNRISAGSSKTERSFFHELISGEPNYTHYKLDGDLNLYDPNGNLSQIWNTQVKKGMVPFGISFSAFFDRAISQNLNRLDAIQIQRLVKILEIVNQGYFANKGPNTDTVIQFLDKLVNREGLSFSPFQDSNISLVKSRIGAPSAGCLAIAKGLSEHQADDYIGAQLSTGSDSTRTDGSGVRTDGSGVRTDSGSLKVRAPVFPCLMPDSKI